MENQLDLNSLIATIKDENTTKNSVNTDESNDRRDYREIKSLKISDDPSFQINDTDSTLLKKFKEFCFENELTYGTFIGKNKISYSTFYSMRNGKLSFEMFERLISCAGNYKLKLEIYLV